MTCELNTNKFFTLLTGECWHEWDGEVEPYNFDILRCTKCLKNGYIPHPDHLSNPLPVIRWMEREMPVILDNYYQYMWVEQRSNSYIETMNDILNLSNLADYLKKHREWGMKECNVCKGKGEYLVYIDELPPYKKHSTPCPFCNGTGIIKHPALKYLEEGK